MSAKTPDFGRCEALIAEERERFDAFYRLLTEYNQRFNLTAVTEEEEVIHKHFLDSVAGEYLIGRGERVAEVGSGAGFPSIPIAIVREDLRFTLIESTGKKCEFLRAAVRELGLGVEVLCARAEDVARGPLRESFGVCIARAVARLNTLSEYCLPLVKKGGSFIAWKSDSAEEFEEAQNALKILGGRGETIRYELPDGYGARMLVRVKKEKNTPKEYPRGRGLERRRPL